MKRARELAARHGVDSRPLVALLEALAAEPDAPTTVTDPVNGHLADSLSVLPELPRTPDRIADMGSGAGFPGLVLAAAFPQARVWLVESQRRHAAVAGRLAAAAGLENVEVVACRVEDWAEGRCRCDLVTARALAPLAVLVEYAAPLLERDGLLAAWKGARDPGEERAGEEAAMLVGLTPQRVVRVEPFPGAHSRHLHLLAKTADTPPRFPRRPGMARKRPLAR